MENQKQWWMIAVCMTVQTVLVAYLVLGQPTPKVDAKLLNVTDAILDQGARLSRMEQENAILFRLIRHGNDQIGVIPDGEAEPNPRPVPLPPPPRRTGTPLGDVPNP
jgi:hypothetical protein